MCDELEIFELIEDDRNNFIKERRNERSYLRHEMNPFQYMTEREFIQNYRLTKELAQNMCEELKPLMTMPKKPSDLTVENRVLTALSFYATGSYQRPIGGIVGHSMAQQTVSSAIAQVTACLNNQQLRRKYIVFPQTAENRTAVRAEFFRKFGIPGVLGCVDCTHIIRPSENEEWYFCRKHYHSLNVQLICDANMQITSVDASHGGRSHDSFIWNNHPIKNHMENLNENTWLLGDSGYPLRKYLLTPILDAVPETPEAYYTTQHVKTRNIIERTIGLLKQRFRCLLSDRVLHYTPRVAASIVNACVILHNICNTHNVILPDFDVELPVDRVVPVGQADAVDNNNRALQLGVTTRTALIHRLWESRHA